MLITQQQLQDWLGYQRPGDLERFLQSKGVAYWRAKGGEIVTTQAALDSAMLKRTTSNVSVVSAG